MLLNPVVISVAVMTVLCLLKLNVILSLIIAALTGGLLAGIPLQEGMKILIKGMGGNAETALSYILLGALALAIDKTGLAGILARGIEKMIKDRRTLLVLLLGIIACFSQNLIPVHIAFIPILIPPLISIMNRLKIDRRAVACALTFGLKAPYVTLPVGFGLMFHNIIRDEMTINGMEITTSMIWRSMWLPGLGMLIGLLVAVLYTYRKPREYRNIEKYIDETAAVKEEALQKQGLNRAQWGALVGALVALVVQLITESLPLGALGGITTMVILGAIRWKEIDELLQGGIGMMGFVAFVMLVASGYGAVIRATGGVETLVQGAAGMIGGSKLVAAFIMILMGLVVTMGIGTSFGTIPILAVLYVPLAAALNFSIPATIALIGTAGALGDAGSPASDSTLGPTAGLNVDGQHDHIWDTCVPTFLHFNIPLVIFGVLASMIL